MQQNIKVKIIDMGKNKILEIILLTFSSSSSLKETICRMGTMIT
jgi:hypothetical protein